MIEHISQSMLGQWERCGEQFRRRWLENEIIPPGIAARIGTGMHKGAEVNHRAKLTTGKDEPLSVVQDAARDGYVKSCQGGVFFPPDEVSGARKQLADGVDVAVKLAGVYHSSLAPLVQPAMVEERIYLEHPELPIPFSGMVDVYTSDKWLPDLKSADKKWSNGRAHHEIQATLYNELIREATGSYPEKLSFEVFTKTKYEHQSNITTRTPEDFELLVQRAKQMLKAIRSGVFLPAQAGSWICSQKWCGYWPSCHYISIRLKSTKE